MAEVKFLNTRIVCLLLSKYCDQNKYFFERRFGYNYYKKCSQDAIRLENKVRELETNVKKMKKKLNKN